MKRVIISAAAERDIESAAAWYEARREGSGQEFYDRVIEPVEKIEKVPEAYAVVSSDARKVQLRKFPYSPFYKIMPGNSLVLACLHARRHPDLAKEAALGVIRMPEPE